MAGKRFAFSGADNLVLGCSFAMLNLSYSSLLVNLMIASEHQQVARRRCDRVDNCAQPAHPSFPRKTRFRGNEDQLARIAIEGSSAG